MVVLRCAKPDFIIEKLYDAVSASSSSDTVLLVTSLKAALVSQSSKNSNFTQSHQTGTNISSEVVTS